jgi:hypothetical protein
MLIILHQNSKHYSLQCSNDKIIMDPKKIFKLDTKSEVIFFIMTQLFFINLSRLDRLFLLFYTLKLLI